MGYYTKLKLSCQLNKDAPLDILEKLCNDEMWKELAMIKFGTFEGIFIVEETPELPIEHKFGKSKRWEQIFGSSTCRFNRKRRTLKIDCEIKAHDNIYQDLIDWLKPFIISGKAKTKGEDTNYWIDILN